RRDERGAPTRPREHNRAELESPSHGENRCSSPLGSANDFNDVVALEACRLATSPTFLQWTVLSKIGSRPPCDRRLEEAEDWRSPRRAGIGAYIKMIKMTRARIAARSAEQIEPTDALLAGQRKVSNGIAGLAAAGSSRHRQKTRQFLPAQASCRDPGTRLELRSHRRSSNANSLCSRNSAGSPEICATLQRDILQQHF